MSARVVKGSPELGAKIRHRRNELGLTIEEAAGKAGIGTKTWSRYEAGESIRQDKLMSICKALSWSSLPGQQEEEIDLAGYRNSDAWPRALADELGEGAALSFVIGSEILLDHIQQDLVALSARPRGTHVGELEFSWVKEELPAQFLPRYDYEFLYCFQSVVAGYRRRVSGGNTLTAGTVMEQLALYLTMEASGFLMESVLPQLRQGGEGCGWEDWAFSLIGDMDVVTFLYSGFYLEREHPYHFDHWREVRFGDEE